MKRFLCLMLMTFLLCSAVNAQKFEGAESVEAGRVASFTSDIEGGVIVFPTENVDVIIDSNQKQFYIVTNIPGKYYVAFFGVIDGKAVTVQRRLEVIGNLPPTPPPIPDIDEDLELLPELTLAEKTAIGYGFRSCLYHVEKGNIKNVSGLRSTFKIAVYEKLITKSEAVDKYLDNYSERIVWDTVETVCDSFKKFLAELDMPWRGADTEFPPAKKNQVQGESPVGGNCPSGTCPVYYYGGY